MIDIKVIDKKTQAAFLSDMAIKLDELAQLRRSDSADEFNKELVRRQLTENEIFPPHIMDQIALITMSDSNAGSLGGSPKFRTLPTEEVESMVKNKINILDSANSEVGDDETLIGDQSPLNMPRYIRRVVNIGRQKLPAPPISNREKLVSKKEINWQALGKRTEPLDPMFRVFSPPNEKEN